MVCQAASQTRFRALKHECGVAGNATIIVRVIACFQPLRDCQVCVVIPFVRISFQFEYYLSYGDLDCNCCYLFLFRILNFTLFCSFSVSALLELFVYSLPPQDRYFQIKVA